MTYNKIKAILLPHTVKKKHENNIKIAVAVVQKVTVGPYDVANVYKHGKDNRVECSLEIWSLVI